MTDQISSGAELSLFDASPVPTLLIDADSARIVGANGAAAERYGHSRAELEALHLSEIVDADSASRSLGQRHPDSGAPVDVEMHRHRRKDGTAFPVITLSRHIVHRGRPAVIMTITELSELQPVHKEERFREKMEALERLGGGIAHEFNNLMTSILSAADLVVDDAGISTAVRNQLSEIRAAAWRGASVTRQLLAFSGGQSVSLRETHPNELVHQLLPLMKHLLPPAVSIATGLRASGAIEVDPAHLEQVILSLVLNAVEAMPDGGVVTITTDDIGPFATIAVADNGLGMDESTLARLFEPFHSTKGLGGRGLGLASVYGTVRRMHGSVDIESAEGRGTRVRLYFNRVVATVELELAAPASGPAPGGEIVLVVDDERSVRAPICTKLRTLGYYVLEATNGEDALRVMQQHHAPVHLVISDVMMPEMDGAELVRLLRSWYPGMRVLFMSGYSPQYVEARGGMVEGAHFLAKPFTLDGLATRVREILDSEWGKRSTAASPAR